MFCVPPDSYAGTLIPVWWYWEVEPWKGNQVMKVVPSHMRLVPLQKKLESQLNLFPACQDTEKVGSLQPGRKSSPVPDHCHCNLRLLVSRTIRNKLISHPIYSILLQQHELILKVMSRLSSFHSNNDDRSKLPILCCEICQLYGKDSNEINISIQVYLISGFPVAQWQTSPTILEPQEMWV